MISWGTILYGVALSTIVTAVLLIAVKRERKPHVLIAALAATFLGPLTWNAVLHRAANAMS